jgi:hypothetical protein
MEVSRSLIECFSKTCRAETVEFRQLAGSLSKLLRMVKRRPIHSAVGSRRSQAGEAFLESLPANQRVHFSIDTH